MKKYKFSFMGRKVGTISKVYKITDEVIAESIFHGKSKLYDNYEHIRILSVSENNKQVGPQAIKKLLS